MKLTDPLEDNLFDADDFFRVDDTEGEENGDGDGDGDGIGDDDGGEGAAVGAPARRPREAVVVRDFCSVLRRDFVFLSKKEIHKLKRFLFCAPL